MILRFAKNMLLLASALAVTSCGGSGDEAMNIAFIGEESDLVQRGLRLSPAGQHVNAATAQGLVRLNAAGEVVPAIAERWIVTDDGMSYIFRLRNSNWADGVALSGANVLAALNRNLAQLQGTSLGLDLDVIAESRAMTGRVIEIRLKSPMPQFLHLLAQPEMGLRRGDRGVGPMKMLRQNSDNDEGNNKDNIGAINAGKDGDGTRGGADRGSAKDADQTGGVWLEVLPPEARGLPSNDKWQRGWRNIALQSLPAHSAIAAFDNSDVDVVLNGQLAQLPRVDTGPLSRGTVRVDAAFGLLGIRFNHSRGLLADPVRREAMAMAIARENLLQPFNIGGWAPSTNIVPANLPGRGTSLAQRWAGTTIEDRQAEARRRIASYTGGSSSNRGSGSSGSSRSSGSSGSGGEGGNAGNARDKTRGSSTSDATGVSTGVSTGSSTNEVTSDSIGVSSGGSSGAASTPSGSKILRITMEEGPGSDILFNALAANFQTIGVELQRAKDGEQGDLTLIDRLARSDDVRWYLNQFHCSLQRGLCSAEADQMVSQALSQTDSAIRQRLLLRAERKMQDDNIYIPLGAPIRWSLVRGGVEGFFENRWGFHPLFEMAYRPI